MGIVAGVERNAVLLLQEKTEERTKLLIAEQREKALRRVTMRRELRSARRRRRREDRSRSKSREPSINGPSKATGIGVEAEDLIATSGLLWQFLD